MRFATPSSWRTFTTYSLPVSPAHRRKFIALAGGAAAWPLAVRAQQPGRVRRIGMLIAVAESDPVGQRNATIFRQSLQELGWTEGRNLNIERRWAAGDVVRSRDYAVELVGLEPDLIVAVGTPSVAALKQATRSVPVVFAIVNDPVAQGFIASMAHPGGNITGFSFLEYSMVGKSLEMLKQVAPSLTRVAVMFNPATYPYYNIFLRSFEGTARTLSLEVTGAPIDTPADIEETIARLGGQGSGLLVTPDPFNTVHRNVIMRAAERHRVPASYSYREYVRDGALMSYGADIADIARRTATYVDRILQGTSPADLPAQAPTKFELAINLKTAKALGLEVPSTLLAIADEIVE
jgi:putative tryptophan/tyrosine transport system substrate-binding protein